jgi:hypothetical protein
VNIKKIVIGVRPATKLYEVWTNWGGVADAVIAGVAQRPFRKPNLFSGIAEVARPPGGMRLLSEDRSLSLSVSSEDIIYTRHTYSSAASLNVESANEEFSGLWGIVNSLLHIQSVRRIGIVAEHRLEADEPSKILLEKLTRLPLTDLKIPTRLNFHFENRIPLPDGAAPDVETSDFINVIYALYDSVLDADNPTDKSINCNIDVQRYYAPSITGNDVTSELRRLKGQFDKQRHEYDDLLRGLGIVKQ